MECTIITEPIQKNTAPATTIAALAAIEQYGNPLLLVMPADHLIGRPDAFQKAIDKASAVAEAGFMVSFGVKPTREETGFGYITVEGTESGENSDSLKVVSFKEKPDKRAARQLMSGGNCYWNSGIFLFKAKPYLDVIGATYREVGEVCARAYQKRGKDYNFVKINASEFEKCPEISIDYAVMEHARNLMLVPTDMQWQDLGSWDALAGIFKKDKDGNRVTGNPVLSSSKGNIVFSDNKLVSLMGIDDCIVINSEDAVLVAKQNCAGSLKSLVNVLKEQKRSEVEEHRKVYRPWGSYETIMEAANFKIKLLVINPGQSLSLQSHQHRSEHWVVVKGEAVISCDDDTSTLGVNQSTYIPALSKHRIENRSDKTVNIVEVQCGSYLEEDDIVRYQDHYGRHKTNSSGVVRTNHISRLYKPQELERQAQEFWRKNSSFRARPDPQREKFYCLSMFPYPSGQLHMGHVRNYVIGDAISRYQSMLGKNVLQPMGWDAFGLPAENAAIEHNESPADWTYANIKTMRLQLQGLGLAYDWRREITTCRPDYYRWEQWFFIQLFAKGLIYRKEAWVNWDPVDKTVLANEQVIDGKGWRSGAAVERRKAPQWFLKTTHYAEELWSGIESLRAGWPKPVIKMQKAWIGKSHGVEIQFALQGRAQTLSVFTTRPDTLMGVSCIALSPEHPLVVELMEGREDLRDFVAAHKKCPIAESEMTKREKTGLDTGLRCVHPLSGAILPVWCANFVLMEYGRGAVMSVPAHDQRDWLFAQRYSLPRPAVVYPADGEAHDFQRGAYTRPGILRNTGAYDGMPSREGGEAIVRELEAKRRARRVTQYRLRDWGISRQRYWGCPIPMMYAGDDCHPMPEEDLPRVLDESMRAWRERKRAQTQLVGDENSRPPRANGEPRHETDTLDTFFESSWYYARFAGLCDKAIFSEEVDYWLPVDQYVGGIEHAVLHLLYARLFHKIMRDLGLLKGDEPFTRLLAQGMVLKDGQKMSKSRNNTVNPEELIKRYGADTIRLFVLFAAPPEQALEWSESGVEGAFRFLKRLWKAVFEHCQKVRTEPSQSKSKRAQCRALRHEIHATIAKVSDDLGRRHTFNTAIAALMKLMNSINRFDDDSQSGLDLRHEGLSALVMMLSPMVPHITHSLWFALGHQKALVESRWPQVDPQALSVDSREIAVQVNGKLRGRLRMPSGSEQSAIRAAVLADERLSSFIAPRTIRKLIVVPDRLVNFVLD